MKVGLKVLLSEDNLRISFCLKFTQVMNSFVNEFNRVIDGVGWFRPNIWPNLVLIEIRIRNKTRL